jgi:hypothetical protein
VHYDLCGISTTSTSSYFVGKSGIGSNTKSVGRIHDPEWNSTFNLQMFWLPEVAGKNLTIGSNG